VFGFLMPPCRHTTAAAVVAAREVGYVRAAELIQEERLSPERIVRLFSASASKTANRDAAFVVLAGSIALYGVGPQGWSPEPETSLALKLLGRAAFDRVADDAAHFVAQRWPEINALASSSTEGPTPEPSQ
jgi:hypothetical protein